jgi:hypothetical protein
LAPVSGFSVLKSAILRWVFRTDVSTVSVTGVLFFGLCLSGTGIVVFPPSQTTPPPEIAGPSVGRPASRRHGDGLGLLDVADPTPSIADIFGRAEGAIRQQEQRRLAVLRIPGAALASNLDEAQRDHFADCGRNRLALNSVFDEVLVCAGQEAVFFRFKAVLR